MCRSAYEHKHVNICSSRPYEGIFSFAYFNNKSGGFIYIAEFYYVTGQRSNFFPAKCALCSALVYPSVIIKRLSAVKTAGAFDYPAFGKFIFLKYRCFFVQISVSAFRTAFFNALLKVCDSSQEHTQDRISYLRTAADHHIMAAAW